MSKIFRFLSLIAMTTVVLLAWFSLIMYSPVRHDPKHDCEFTGKE